MVPPFASSNSRMKEHEDMFTLGIIGTGLALSWLSIKAAEWMAENFK